MEKNSPRYKDKYTKEVVPKLKDKFGYKNINEVPKLKKISINQGIGKYSSDKKAQEIFRNEITTITGQYAVLTKSKVDVSNFKLRKGMGIGVMVTLRRDRMYEFFDRLVSVSIPRIRDFRGLNAKSFDKKGNYNLGLTEQIIFPEINIDKVKNIHGLNISFITTAKTDEEAKFLLQELGMPFKKNN